MRYTVWSWARRRHRLRYAAHWARRHRVQRLGPHWACHTCAKAWP